MPLVEWHLFIKFPAKRSGGHLKPRERFTRASLHCLHWKGKDSTASFKYFLLGFSRCLCQLCRSRSLTETAWFLVVQTGVIGASEACFPASRKRASSVHQASSLWDRELQERVQCLQGCYIFANPEEQSRKTCIETKVASEDPKKNIPLSVALLRLLCPLCWRRVSSAWSCPRVNRRSPSGAPDEVHASVKRAGFISRTRQCTHVTSGGRPRTRPRKICAQLLRKLSLLSLLCWRTTSTDRRMLTDYSTSWNNRLCALLS